jgi:hypothetical protein
MARKRKWSLSNPAFSPYKGLSSHPHQQGVGVTIDLHQPMTFQRSVETVAAALTIALVRLRDEVNFGQREEGHDPLPAAHLLLAMLEDATRETEQLVERLEPLGRA